MQYFEYLSPKKMIFFLFSSLFFLFPHFLDAKEMLVERKIKWNNSTNFKNLPHFEGEIFLKNQESTPVFSEILDLDGEEFLSAQLIFEDFKRLDFPSIASLGNFPSNFSLRTYPAFEKGKSKLIIQIDAIKQNGNELLILQSFKLQINTKAAFRKISLKKSAANSVLASGDWYKIATTQNGIHRIDYNGLKNMGINPDLIDPRKIKFYGNGAGMLPTPNSAFRYDDLNEVSIQVKGEEDGKFNSNDFILFFGESQIDQWIYNKQSGTYGHQSNLYSDTTYYFLTVSAENGKRISKINSESTFTQESSEADYTYLYENEKSNLTKSGKVWLGEEFDRVNTQSFNLSIPNLISSQPLRMLSSATSRSIVPSTFAVTVNGANVLVHNMGITIGGYEKPFTSGLNYVAAEFTVSNQTLNVTYAYNKPASGSIGWLDFFEIVARVNLKNSSGNFVFKDKKSIASAAKTKFNISTNRTLNVWDITNPVVPFEIEGVFSQNNYSIVCNTDSLREFAVVDGSNFLQPKIIGKILNQNLHALSPAHGLIITHPDFVEEANRLAKFHKENDGLDIHVINIQQIYNEFSSGSQDLTALRDFLKIFYEKTLSGSVKLSDVMLFGRASYDYKYRIKVNSNFVPAFQSFESFDPTTSYCSDDYICFLDENEGNWDRDGDPGELMDIGLGRLPVSSASEAAEMVDKFISYTKETSFGDWRNRMVFMADDEDFNAHQNQSNNLANSVGNRFPEYNLQKIFLDAYPREITAGGARYPEANKAMNNAIEKGCLIFNYTGHGGEVGLTAERVMGIEDINAWSNKNKLPLFVTATCEFSRFDDPSRISAGEMVLLNPKGGGIGLFTTVRLVYSGQNEILNSRFFDNVGLDSASQLNPPRLGDVLMKTKNSYLDKNTRNFTFLGDPFLKMSYPKNEIIPTEINGISILQFNDTIKALEKVTISGKLIDKKGVLMSDFDGEIFPTLFDKSETYKTLVNNPEQSNPMEFRMQNNVLYRGKASVNDGLFSFTFIVPKDISYQFGFGKFSAYANNGVFDASGYSNSLIIGGTSDSIGSDKTGPELKLFMNDDKFVNGGLTDENPTFIAKLFDENGINTTGRGIGRDLTLVLNNENSKAIVVNDYYQATINSYQSGEVRYKFKNLPVGKHTLRFRSYDAYNNPAESSLDFEIKPAGKPSIQHVLNYPNPFTRSTVFHFDHNQAGQDISVSIQIFTVNGQLIKTLDYDGYAEGNHFSELSWNGNDEYGDKLANGVYIYKVKFRVSGQKPIEQFQKLVVIN